MASDPNTPNKSGRPGAAPGDPIVIGLLEAYAAGVFPMSHGAGGPIGWYDPDPRGIIPLDQGALRVPRSLRSKVRSRRFRITTDEAFDRVIRACAAPRAGQTGDEGWIDERIVDAYTRLHVAGHAHSVEAWLVDGNARRLVGGLYGVHLRGLFAGESMFSRPDLGGTDASKVCLVWLWHHLRAHGFTLLDTQFMTDHLRSLGGIEIAREAYHDRLATALRTETAWLPFRTPEV